MSSFSRPLPSPPVDTHSVLARDLTVRDRVWVGYRTMEPLVGVVESVEPAGKGDYRIVICPDNDEVPTEARLFANDYPGLRRFYCRGRFTDATSETSVCVLLGDATVDGAGNATVDTGTEKLRLGVATDELLETLEFLSVPRIMDDAERFTSGRTLGMAELPDRILATWQPSVVERSGIARNAAETSEAATLGRFRRVGARLAPGARVVTEAAGVTGPWLVPDPNRPRHVQFLTDELHTYLTGSSFAGLSLYDFAADAGRYADIPLGQVTRGLLFGLNRVVGNGVVLVAVPRKPLLHRIFDRVADLS